MFCRRCNRPLYSQLSKLCNPCAAAETLGEELAQPWREEKLRVIAGDIAVSAVRQVRALRLHRPSEAAETSSKSAPAKPPLPRKTPGQKARSRSPPRPERRKEAKRSPGGEAEAGHSKAKPGQRYPREAEVEQSPLERPTPPNFSPSPYSYYSTTEESEGEQEKADKAEQQQRDLQEREKVSQSTPEVRRDVEKERKAESKGAKPLIYTEPKAAAVDVGSAEDKRRSKAEYLASLKSASSKLRLEENPQARKAERPRGNLLQVFDDKPSRKDDGKKRRRKSKWQRK